MTDDRRVDDLRHQLRALGYLDAGVDRFVLGGAIRSRRPAGMAFAASIRSGAIAAALLGPAAAIGLASRLPGLVTGIRDAVVIAIYMAVLFGAAVTVLSFSAALFVSAVARSSPTRGRRVSTAAGVVVSVACLAYLTLWWRTANAGFGWAAPVWTAFALIVAVAISLLMGHVVTLTARAVLVARTAAYAQQERVPGASWRIAVAAGVIAFAGAGSLLVLTTDTQSVEMTVPLSVRSSGARVTVVAVDGFDLNLYQQWRGMVPTPAVRPFPVLDRSGWVPTNGYHRPADRTAPVDDHVGRVTRAAEPAIATLTPVDSRDPARLWTTIATGRSVEVHGVEQLQTRRVAGLRGRLTSEPVSRLLGGATDLLRLTRPTVASNVERRTKTFWEVAAQSGLRTTAINWWATWPADASAGTVISDRAILRLEHGGALDAEIAPADVYEALKSQWPELRVDAVENASTYFRGRAQRELPPLPIELRQVLTRSAELDGIVARLAERAAKRADLLVLYLPGLDIVQHTLLSNQPPKPSEIGQRLAALRQYYEYVGSLIAATVDRVHEGGVVFLITQPGRLHQGSGVLGVIGPGIRPTQTSATILDIAPTVLHALGIPIAREMEGRVIEPLFEHQFLKAYPIRLVDAYGPRGAVAPARSGQPLDDEMIERLRSLGYVR